MYEYMYHALLPQHIQIEQRKTRSHGILLGIHGNELVVICPQSKQDSIGTNECKSGLGTRWLNTK